MDAYVTKGTRLRARWIQVKPAALAGMQLKLAAREVTVTGTVRHVHSDDPKLPVNVTFLVDVEAGSGYEKYMKPCVKCDRPHIEVRAKHVIEVL